jgi:hypothetical protein
VFGAAKVGRFIPRHAGKCSEVEFRTAEVHGEAALILRLGSARHVCSFEITGSLVVGIQWMSNPDKLGRFTPGG